MLKEYQKVSHDRRHSAVEDTHLVTIQEQQKDGSLV